MARWGKFGIATLMFCAAFGCSKNRSNEEAKTEEFAALKMELAIQDLSAGEGCLSFPKLKEALDAIAPHISMYAIPTQLEITGKQHVRENFQRLLALNLLSIQEGQLSSFEALETSSQDQCNYLALSRTDGVPKVFKILPQEGGNRLVATAEDGEGLQYELLTPRRVRLTRKYITHDLPCGSEKNDVFVSVTRLIDWSGSPVPEAIDTADEQLMIDSRFLSLASQAAGFNEVDLYSTASGGELSSQRVIQVSKVRELSQMAPKPEIVTCDGVVNPEPEPEPDPQPEPLPDEGEGGQPDSPAAPGGPEEPNEEGRV